MQKILNDSYHEVLLGVNRQRNEIRKHETEIQELKATVTKLEEQLNALQEDQIEHNESESYASSPITARSCEQLNLSDQSLKSGMYWIDPDGHGTGDAPILVFCNMTSGCTKKTYVLFFFNYRALITLSLIKRIYIYSTR